MNNKKTSIIVVEPDTAEVHYLTPVELTLKKIKIKEQPFVKVFNDLFTILPTLNKTELKLLSLMFLNLKTNRTAVTIPNLHKLISKTSLSRTLKSLKIKKIITSYNTNQIIINHDMFINGKYIIDK